MAKQNGKPTTAQKPERTIRFGAVSASIFVQTANGQNGSTREFRTVNIQRSYRDAEEQAKYTSSFALSDLPAAVRCLELAQHYIETAELGDVAGAEF